MLHRGEGICLFGNVPQIIQTRNSEDIYDKYLDSVLQEFPENLGTTAATPKTDHLFMVRDEGKKRYLLEDYSQIFHHTVSQLLFMSDIYLRDIQTEVELLTMRVKKPDKDDWGKLK